MVNRQEVNRKYKVTNIITFYSHGEQKSNTSKPHQVPLQSSENWNLRAVMETKTGQLKTEGKTTDHVEALDLNL